MPIKKSGVELCVTCSKADNCAERERRGGNVTVCESYSEYVPGIGGDETTSVVVLPETEATSSDLKGLCVNCVHRDDCELPRPETGVWHCENYE